MLRLCVRLKLIEYIAAGLVLDIGEVFKEFNTQITFDDI